MLCSCLPTVHTVSCDRLLHKIIRWIGSPEVHPRLFRAPDPGYIGTIIPDLLDITHELHQVLLWIPEVLKLVLARAMSPGAIKQHIAILHEVFSLPCQVREIHYLEGEVMHLD